MSTKRRLQHIIATYPAAVWLPVVRWATREPGMIVYDPNALRLAVVEPMDERVRHRSDRYLPWMAQRLDAHLKETARQIRKHVPGFSVKAMLTEDGQNNGLRVAESGDLDAMVRIMELPDSERQTIIHYWTERTRDFDRTTAVVGRAMGDIVDWVSGTGEDLSRYSILEAVDAAGRWHDELARKAEQGEVRQVDDVVHRWPDGWTIQRLTQRADLKAEGAAMGHCVGNADYFEEVAAGRAEILSLRDAKGRPRVTLELELDPPVPWTDGQPPPGWTKPVTGDRVIQAKARGNHPPSDPQCKRIAAYLEARQIPVQQWGEATICFDPKTYIALWKKAPSNIPFNVSPLEDEGAKGRALFEVHQTLKTITDLDGEQLDAVYVDTQIDGDDLLVGIYINVDDLMDLTDLDVLEDWIAQLGLYERFMALTAGLRSEAEVDLWLNDEDRVEVLQRFAAQLASGRDLKQDDDTWAGRSHLYTLPEWGGSVADFKRDVEALVTEVKSDIEAFERQTRDLVGGGGVPTGADPVNYLSQPQIDRYHAAMNEAEKVWGRAP